MTRLHVNGVHLNVELSGAGLPLVLLHGFTGSITSWKPHIPIFEKRFQTIAVDLLGHGSSDSPADPMRYRMERCVEDLISIFEPLGLEQVGLLGYSMGGRVALHVAAAHPDRVHVLVLESASPGLAGLFERQARMARGGGPADSIAGDGEARLPESVRVGLRAQRMQNNPRGLANSLHGLGTGAQTALWGRLREIRVPTLLIPGVLDQKFTAIARAMAGALPNARLALVPDAGHTVHLEQPEVFDKMVMDFLEIRD